MGRSDEPEREERVFHLAGRGAGDGGGEEAGANWPERLRAEAMRFGAALAEREQLLEHAAELRAMVVDEPVEDAHRVGAGERRKERICGAPGQASPRTRDL